MSQPRSESLDATLARIETKLDNALAVQAEHAKDITKLFSELAAVVVRLVKVETRLGAAWAALGLIVTVGSILTAVLH